MLQIPDFPQGVFSPENNFLSMIYCWFTYHQRMISKNNRESSRFFSAPRVSLPKGVEQNPYFQKIFGLKSAGIQSGSESYFLVGLGSDPDRTWG